MDVAVLRSVPLFSSLDSKATAELGEYLSLPYRTFSAGMGTRLGFSIATAINPEILLMDEGIGAGDARFTERASRRMTEFLDKSRILVLASHSEYLLRENCSKGVLLRSGGVVAVGPLDDNETLVAALRVRDPRAKASCARQPDSIPAYTPHQ